MIISFAPVLIVRENILNALKLTDITISTLYQSFTTTIKALSVLALKIWQILEAPDLTNFDRFSKIFRKLSLEKVLISAIQRHYTC